MSANMLPYRDPTTSQQLLADTNAMKTLEQANANFTTGVNEAKNNLGLSAGATAAETAGFQDQLEYAYAQGFYGGTQGSSSGLSGSQSGGQQALGYAAGLGYEAALSESKGSTTSLAPPSSFSITSTLVSTTQMDAAFSSEALAEEQALITATPSLAAVFGKAQAQTKSPFVLPFSTPTNQTQVDANTAYATAFGKEQAKAGDTYQPPFSTPTNQTQVDANTAYETAYGQEAGVLQLADSHSSAVSNALSTCTDGAFWFGVGLSGINSLPSSGTNLPPSSELKKSYLALGFFMYGLAASTRNPIPIAESLAQQCGQWAVYANPNQPFALPFPSPSSSIEQAVDTAYTQAYAQAAGAAGRAFNLPYASPVDQTQIAANTTYAQFYGWAAANAGRAFNLPYASPVDQTQIAANTTYAQNFGWAKGGSAVSAAAAGASLSSLAFQMPYTSPTNQTQIAANIAYAQGYVQGVAAAIPGILGTNLSVMQNVFAYFMLVVDQVFNTLSQQMYADAGSLEVDTNAASNGQQGYNSMLQGAANTLSSDASGSSSTFATAQSNMSMLSQETQGWSTQFSNLVSLDTSSVSTDGNNSQSFVSEAAAILSDEGSMAAAIGTPL